jgi:hypothetical protein
MGDLIDSYINGCEVSESKGSLELSTGNKGVAHCILQKV